MHIKRSLCACPFPPPLSRPLLNMPVTDLCDLIKGCICTNREICPRNVVGDCGGQNNL